jgi:hypothetical protein
VDEPQRRDTLAIAAVIVAAAGLLLISCGPVLYDLLSPPPPPKGLLDRVVEGVKDGITSNAASAAPARIGRRWIEIGGLSLGVAGIVMAAIARARREHARAIHVAIFLGAVAVLWYHYALLLAVLAILIVILFFLG